MDQATIEELLGYLSDIYNKSLPIYELVTTRNYNRDRALLNINELYTNYSSVDMFIKIHPHLNSEEVQQFLSNFNDFYFELKQVFLQEDDNTALLYNKLSIMKESFEALTAKFDVL